LEELLRQFKTTLVSQGSAVSFGINNKQ